MKKAGKIWLSIAGILILAGIVLTMAAKIMGGVTGIYMDSDFKLHVMAESDGYTYESEPLKNIKEIEVEMMSHNITVRPSEDDNVYVHIVSTSENAPEIAIGNGKIKIKETTSQRWLSINLGFLSGHMGNDEVILYLPDGITLESLQLTTSDGNITSRANVTVEETALTTSSGNLTVKGLDSNQTTFRSSDGNIEMEGTFSNETNVRTFSGNITAEGSFRNQVELKTSDGNIDFVTDTQRASSSITGETSDGTIRINNEKFGSKFREKNGSSHTYQFETSSGNIDITLK